MAKKSIKAGKLPQNKGSITSGPLPSVKTLSFSFKHFVEDHQKFSYNQQNSAYFCKVLERLKNLSLMTADEFTSNRSSTLRAHPIDWDGTTEADGFSHLNEQFQSYTPYQFSISSNAHGRIHGFIANEIFHVIWLDPEHKLYA
ncbi:MAG: hypothetical protein E6868_16590 [Pantoea sp.]|uniref:hypothetical protein n=1 Tax=Pantoea TaxID=53335 RepID=UPI0023F1F17E|nr:MULTISPECIES: hypothetical protein [Pantoea]MDU1574857.1 hypothetical protein [Pantoea sp.]